MQKLEWFSLQQLPSLQSLTLVKCIGKVKSIQQKSNYYSFTINNLLIGNERQEDKQRQYQNNQNSNSNILQLQLQQQRQALAEAEATIYEQQKIYRTLQLPQKNNYVVVVGNTYKKQISSKTFITKIKVRLFKNLQQNQAYNMYTKVRQIKKLREKARQQTQLNRNLTKPKRSLLKQLKNSILPLQIRSLILGCVYMTLQNNEDLNSYTFSLYTIQNHRLSKSYIQSKKLKEQSLKYMSQFIDTELNYLVEKQIIQLKEILEGQKIYKVHRILFTQIQMRTMGIINERQKTGTLLGDIVKILNKEKGLFDEKDYIYNENFVQKILRKFIQESRIYKTSEKVLYPNS